MDKELLDWLNLHAFPEEAKFSDTVYALRAYTAFVEDLKRGPNTRACIFATIHTGATLLLMDLLEKSGLVCMVGKVNMDRNSPAILCETSAAESARTTEEWLSGCHFTDTLPILTPRFIPSCTDNLMRSLSEIQKNHGLPVQSHLSENRKEIEWVRELCPRSQCYGDAYKMFDLFGGEVKTIMAHCVWSSEPEISLMKERGVYIAHCPQSNSNICSGAAPLRRYLDGGLNVGLGSDVAGGVHTSIFRAMTDAITASKLRAVFTNDDCAPVTMTEAFYLATRGGGSFFGNVGSFDAGYEADILVIDDRRIAPPFSLSVAERLERAVYLCDDRNIYAKYVRGKVIFAVST
jgi:guanine deaminase